MGHTGHRRERNAEGQPVPVRARLHRAAWAYLGSQETGELAHAAGARYNAVQRWECGSVG